MKKTLLTFLGLSVIALMTSCNKEGCTNQNADNYDAEAKTNDFSCTYTGKVYFWQDAVTSDSLFTIEGHTMLRFELEGDIVDSIPTQSLVAPEGICGTTGVMTIPRTFTGNHEWNYKYRVKGTNFVTLYEGFITLQGGQCEEVRLQ